jgi:hypothetical protein
MCFLRVPAVTRRHETCAKVRNKTSVLNICFGSISEQITLNTPGSGDERKAELICRLISGVFSSQFGQKRPFSVNKNNRSNEHPITVLDVKRHASEKHLFLAQKPVNVE